ncbi:MAG TPA: glycosyltransferase family 4 protein [Thermomicrobiales bacterium]
MKIDFVTTFGVVRGFPSFPEATLARRFVADGHPVRALTYFAKSSAMIDTHHDVIDGAVVHRIRRKGFFTPGVLGWIAREKPDVAHLHHLSNRLSALALPAYHARRVPVVFSPYGILHDPVLVDDTDRPLATPIHAERIQSSLVRTAKTSGIKRGAGDWLLHRPLFAADAVHAMSLHEKRVVAELGVPEARIHFIPVGIDATLLASDEPIARTPAPTVLYLGQTKYRKGWDILARAIPDVVAAIPNARFIFAGHSGRDRADFDALVRELGVSAVIEAPGRVSEAEKIRLLHSSWVLTLPARYEGFGIPLVEAMMVGTPVVTTNVPACNEIVRDGETGLVVEPDDPVALAAALIRLLGDAALRTRLAREAERDAMERYEARVVARQFEALYASLIAERR